MPCMHTRHKEDSMALAALGTFVVETKVPIEDKETFRPMEGSSSREGEAHRTPSPSKALVEAYQWSQDG